MTQKTPTKILIVDDEPSICDLFSRWLTGEGYECVTAADVDEGWKLLTENGISLILLDIMMPEQPGVILLHKIREKHLDVAIIMVTSMDATGFAEETLELGAYAYISKPCDQDVIVLNVASALKRREQIRALKDQLQELKSSRGE